MLFNAVSYVSLLSINRCSFSDKETARYLFYKRAKLLFDLGAEIFPLNKAQGAVLLSHQVSPDEPLTGSLWLVYAMQNAVILGQQPVSFAADLQDGMKKRLWWSILLRDRCLCLGLRRRTQITSNHFNAETSYLKENDFADKIAHSNVSDRDSKMILFETLQHQCRLAILVTDMATFTFTKNRVSSLSLSFSAFQSHRFTTFIRVTYMYYYAAQSNLSHYESLLVESHADFAGKSYTNQLAECGAFLKDAVASLTDTMEYFSDCPNILLCTLAFIATPLVNSAFDLKLARSYEEMVVRRRHVDLLADIYHQLALLYNVTNYVAFGTNQILSLVYNLSQEFLLRDGQSHVSAAGPSQFTKSARIGNNLKMSLANCRDIISVAFQGDISVSPCKCQPLA
ncbi:hypothetical protein BDV12DRAFT_203622 [Aspergillus spectabilis]